MDKTQREFYSNDSSRTSTKLGWDAASGLFFVFFRVVPSFISSSRRVDRPDDFEIQVLITFRR